MEAITSPEAQEHYPDANQEVDFTEMSATLNWFRLRFKTTCAKCRDELEPGDWAAYSREEKGQLLCKPCGKEEEGE